MQQLGGIPAGTRFWHQLSAEEQRDVLDRQRLAYLAEVRVNWCPALGTVLSNEEVTSEGRSERGNHLVFRRPLRQWMLRITAYADRLERDLEPLDWPESVKLMQRNWIGRSEGAEVEFAVEDREDSITVFTTRPDTLYGATYMVLAPEHPLVELVTTPSQRDAVRAYVAAAVNKSELARTAETKTKSGVFTGGYAINPVWPAGDPRARIPIWIADYVLLGYGTGAIMAVPAHDTRDLEFAEQFALPVLQVVQPPDGFDWRGYVEEGTAINSPPPGTAAGGCDFNGLATPEAKRRIIAWLEARDCGRGRVQYRLRDWLFSRQRYWGEPFPIVHCGACGTVALGEDALPVRLPDIDNFMPTPLPEDSTADPEPPLARASDWVRTTCPRCGGVARRELNTMPNWAGSCWYYLRFMDPHNEREFCSKQAERYWMHSLREDGRPHVGGVDLYLGGAEHAVLHLLYARFWHKVLYDLGYVSTPEPFGRLFNQGMIRAFAYRDSRGVPVGYDEIDFRDDDAYLKATGERLEGAVEKMSKSLKNVINPDEVVAEYGADSLRLYEMFMGPLEASKPWNPRDVPGVLRFLQRAWRLVVDPQTGGLSGRIRPGPALAEPEAEPIERALHRMIRKVTEDLGRMAFNTAIAAMMEFVNEATSAPVLTRDQLERFVLILSPFAPHIAEELWQRLRRTEWKCSLACERWPTYDASRVVESQIEIAVQLNGKLVATVVVPADADEDAMRSAARGEARVSARLAGRTIRKEIVVKGRLVNIVVG
ncbi:MAG: leucine--tRNA ligase [Phycisphaerae bacterium]|nr:leucine--tRNA ligase [Phycisphaerae bacterium]